MGTSDPSEVATRILVLGPTARDARITGDILARARIAFAACRDLDHLCDEIEIGAAAILIPEEHLSRADRGRRLVALLQRQAAWSDLPVLIISASADGDRSGRPN